MATNNSQKIAVVGPGIAGATCAGTLTRARHSVQVFDKSRGPGGRLATRRVSWIGPQGHACTTRLDHGAVGITARSAPFRHFIDRAQQAGWLAEWSPTLAAGSLPLGDGGRLRVPVPDLPALCHHLLKGATATWSFAVDSLDRGPLGWKLEARGERHSTRFDVVVLALPPAQAAHLLGHHRCDWARHAAVVPMQPCWTLMGVANAPEDGPESAPGWDRARPPTGPLAWVLRNDTRPGRQRVPGQAQWVAHARTGWSRRRLEQPAAWVRQQMEAALAECLGRPIDWHHCAVHRWRFALSQAQAVLPAESGWWNVAKASASVGTSSAARASRGLGCLRSR